MRFLKMQYVKLMNIKEAHWILRFALWGMRYVQEIAINMRRGWKMSEIKLKPCPFCGGMARLCIDYENSIISTMFRDYVYFIKCKSCGALIYGSHDKKRNFRQMEQKGR